MQKLMERLAATKQALKDLDLTDPLDQPDEALFRTQIEQIRASIVVETAKQKAATERANDENAAPSGGGG